MGVGLVPSAAMAVLPWGAPTPLLPLTEDEPVAGVSISDLDGDGDWDLVVPQRDVLRVLVQVDRVDGRPVFDEPSLPLPVPVPENSNGIRGVGLADLDGDGVIEITSWSRSDTRLFVRDAPPDAGEQAPWPTWTAIPSEPPPLYQNLEGGGIVDSDRDGRLEVLIHHAGVLAFDDLSARIDWNPRSESFENRVQPFVDVPSLGTDFALLADLDDDLATDLVIRTIDAPNGYLATTDGQFVVHPTAWQISDIAIRKGGPGRM